MAHQIESLAEILLRRFFAVDSFAEDVKDAVGAGDALLAYATLAQVSSKNEVIAAVLGAIAAAIECEHDGNIPVTPDHLREKLTTIERRANYET